MKEKTKSKYTLKDGVILNEMPCKEGVVLFCSGKTEEGENGHLFIFSGVEGYPDDHRILLKGGHFTDGDPRPLCHQLEREHNLYWAHRKLDDEHEEEYFGTVPIDPVWEDPCGLPQPQNAPVPQSIYEVLEDLLEGDKLCIGYALGGGDSLWGPTVEHPHNQFCRGDAIFVYQRWRCPNSLRMSKVIENPTYLDIIKFANKCVYQDYPQDHTHLEGVDKIGNDKSLSGDVPVYMLHFGS